MLDFTRNFIISIKFKLTQNFIDANFDHLDYLKKLILIDSGHHFLDANFVRIHFWSISSSFDFIFDRFHFRSISFLIDAFFYRRLFWSTLNLIDANFTKSASIFCRRRKKFNRRMQSIFQQYKFCLIVWTNVQNQKNLKLNELQFQKSDKISHFMY